MQRIKELPGINRILSAIEQRQQARQEAETEARAQRTADILQQIVKGMEEDDERVLNFIVGVGDEIGNGRAGEILRQRWELEESDESVTL